MLKFNAVVAEINLETNITLGHLSQQEQEEVLDQLRSLPDVTKVGFYHFVEVLVLIHAIEEDGLIQEIRAAQIMLAEAFARLNLPPKF